MNDKKTLGRELDRLARNCREAILSKSPQDREDPCLLDFPEGACGIASELLGRLILDVIGREVTYITGPRQPKLNDYSHAWLALDGFILDITHDQFEDTGLEGWIFRESLWHADLDQTWGPLPSPSGQSAYPEDLYKFIVSWTANRQAESGTAWH